ncbi:MAG TPA: hypothetical protein VLL52_24360, partial [Anaerolineae bacterium]|nr:hypothetical protein [Anaerolineae bacterium]
GDGTTTDRYIPTQVAGAWIKISVGLQHVCGLKTNGTIWCWGVGTNGRLGNGATSNSLVPVQISSANTYIDVSAGGGTSCAVRSSDGKVECWGRGNTGEMGNSTVTLDNTTPVVASLATGTYAKVVVGGNFVGALTNSGGAIHCWGGNANGQLGVGNTTDYWNTLATVSVSSIDKIEAGNSHMCAYKSATMEVLCWGGDTYGQIGNGVGTTAVTSPFSLGTSQWADVWAGYNHSCGLRTNGTTSCWGNGANNQLGDGGAINQQSPVQINP